MAIILIGFMAAGKSTVARLLAPDYLDTDAIITARSGLPPADYFERHGEASFRRLEEEVLSELVKSDARVIATGGGLVESVKNQKILKQEPQVVYLRAAYDTLVARIQTDTNNRRSLFENATPESFRRLYARRMHIYEGLADLIVDTDQQKPEQLAEIILEHFR